MEQIITDLSDLRKYRTELPNLADDSGLDPYEFRLLAHYKRIGTCTESVATTARKCKMSTGQVSEKRDSLAGKGWITAEEVPVLNGFSYRINVIDRWLENYAKYSGKSVVDIKRALDELANTPTPDGDLYRMYEQNIGPLTPLLADALKDAEQTYPANWIADAMALAVTNNKRNWKYCEAILKRWNTEGKDDGSSPQAQKRRTRKQQGESPLERYAREQGA